MRKRMAVTALVIAMLVVLVGCAPLSGLLGIGSEETQEEPLANGTTTGNILNGGFAVKDGADLLFYYTGGNVYKHGSLVRSNPETGENSLVLEQAGLYMNLADDMLYYCMADGVYRTPLDAPAPERLMEGRCSLLQIAGERMYFISNGDVGCLMRDGSEIQFSQIEKASSLNVYGDKLYYINTDNGQIWQADMDGTDQKVLYDHSVNMFIIIDDVIYFIDSADGFIKRITLGLESLETVLGKPCSGFNVNRLGMYYTQMDDNLCYNAGAGGVQEQVIADFGESAWHRTCMFGEGTLVLRQEELQ